MIFGSRTRVEGIDLDAAGEWFADDRVWGVQIRAADDDVSPIHGMICYLEELELPRGSRLYLQGLRNEEPAHGDGEWLGPITVLDADIRALPFVSGHAVRLLLLLDDSSGKSSAKLRIGEVALANMLNPLRGVEELRVGNWTEGCA